MYENIAWEYEGHALKMKYLVWIEKKQIMKVICKFKSTGQFYKLWCVRKALTIII